jgi:2-amino-4-hydroxy-6-hydroxymethyldihydropteridine diphosphokinase
MTAAIALGSNLPSTFGTPADNLHEALRRLATLGHVKAVSSFHTTAPVGYLDQPQFINAAALLETTLPPLDLLHALLAIEHDMGRDRTSAPPKGPRIIDLDLLLYDDLILTTPSLTLPHPAMPHRAFVLAPLAEIAPTMMHPVQQQTILNLLTKITPSSTREFRPALFWFLTALNILVVAAQLYLLYAILSALAAFAAGIVGWIWYVLGALFLLGIGLSIFLLFRTRRVRSTTGRRIGYFINVLPALIYLLFLVGILLLTIKTTRRRFIINGHYQGTVYVLHTQHAGKTGIKGFWRTTYYVPADGVLVTSDPGIPGFVSDEYDYLEANGHLTRLKDFDPGTMPDTPENRANDKDYGVYFPRGGSIGTTDGCTVEDEEVYVGTSAYLLARNKELNIDAYLRAHPEVCDHP